jgi:hypothetical protein
MKKITVQMTERQIEMVMRAVSNYMSEMSDDDGNLHDKTKRGEDYYKLVSDTYFKTLVPLQSEF